jgi:membrane associated rhomboid family serine protease
MFIAIPVGMNYRTERLPLVTFSLIGLNTLVYLVTLFFFFQTRGLSDLWILQHLWLIPAQSFWWTYLTSMFVHTGILHLAGNMIFLFLFGSCVEDLIGRACFVIFYLLGGLMAEVVYIAMLPEHFASAIPLGGASGAISACMGMYLLLRASAEIEFKYFFWFFVIKAGEFEIPAWVAISFWFLKDLFWAVLGLTMGHGGGGVAFGAHVGGLLGGLGMISLYKWILHKREANESAGVPSHIIIDTTKILAVANAHRQAQAVTSEIPTFFIFDGQEQTGPFTLTQVQQKLAHGEISRDAQYWSDGMTEWQNVLELSSHPVE